MDSTDKNEVKLETGQGAQSPGQAKPETATATDKLKELAQKPKRHWTIHWAATLFSILSLIPVTIWVIKPSQELSSNWYWVDIVFSAFFIVEYVTRSGFRWDRVGYTKTHFFDFIAIVPALVLIHYNVWWFTGWVWIILIARYIRALDRILGDGFITRNALALIGALEEEITDRVMIKILDRVEEDMSRGKFGEAISKVMDNSKSQMLQEIHDQHPQVIKTGLAQAVGLTRTVEKGEEQIFESIVKVLKSQAVDTTIRNSVGSTFATIRAGVAEKSWKKNLGFAKKSKAKSK